MSKQGEIAVETLGRLLNQHVSVSNAENWKNRIELVNRMYCPERNELQRVLALFGPTFDYANEESVSTAIKTARAELKTIVQRMKKANGIK